MNQFISVSVFLSAIIYSSKPKKASLTSKLEDYYINYESLDKIQRYLKHYKQYILWKKGPIIVLKMWI